MFVVVVWDLCRLMEVGYGFVEAMSGLVVVGYRFVEAMSVWLRVCGYGEGDCDRREREREMNKK